MGEVTDADREAAKMLREILAEASGFWHNYGDDSALCLALARHRLEAEKRVADRSTVFAKNAVRHGMKARQRNLNGSNDTGPASMARLPASIGS